jgi:hypothetical protein
VHERLAESVLTAVGQDASWDSVVWPALYLPLAGAVVVLLVSLTRTTPTRARRFVDVGLLLLALQSQPKSCLRRYRPPRPKAAGRTSSSRPTKREQS